jgi:hypothetical protein
MDPEVRIVAAGLIRSLNAEVLRGDENDDELLADYGQRAEPLAVALVEVIRREVLAARDAAETGPDRIG